MTIDWNSKESYQRLLAAVHAASPQNHNYRLIAAYFGQGASYDSIEGRFRKIKVDAAKLKEEQPDAEAQAQAQGRGSANSTPRKSRGRAKTTGEGRGRGRGGGVRGGRVTKPKSQKKGGNAGTKDEATADAVEEMIKQEEPPASDVDGHVDGVADDDGGLAEKDQQLDWNTYQQMEMEYQQDDTEDGEDE